MNRRHVLPFAGLFVLALALPSTAAPIGWLAKLAKAAGKAGKAGKAAGAAAKAAKAAKAVKVGAGALAVGTAARAARGISVAKAAGKCLKAAKVSKGRAPIYVAADGGQLKYFAAGTDAPILTSKPGELGASLKQLRGKVKTQDGSELKGLDLHVEDDVLKHLPQGKVPEGDQLLLANLDQASWPTIRVNAPSGRFRHVAEVDPGLRVLLDADRWTLGRYSIAKKIPFEHGKARLVGKGRKPKTAKELMDKAKDAGETAIDLADLYDGEELAPVLSRSALKNVVVVARDSKRGYRIGSKEFGIFQLEHLADTKQVALVVVVLRKTAPVEDAEVTLARLAPDLSAAANLGDVLSALGKVAPLFANAGGLNKDKPARIYLEAVPPRKAKTDLKKVILYVPKAVTIAHAGEPVPQEAEPAGDDSDSDWCFGCCGLILLFGLLGWFGEKMGWIESSEPPAEG